MSITVATLQEKVRRFPIPVISGLIVLGCFMNHYLRGNLIAELEAQRDQAGREAMQIDENIVAGTKLDVHVEEIQAMARHLDERIVQQAELATNLNYFYGLEAATGVNLSDLRQGSPIPVKDVEKAPYTGVSYYVLLSGAFAQVVGYFDELENGSRIYQLNSFNLQQGRDAKQEQVTLSLNLQLLGWP